MEFGELQMKGDSSFISLPKKPLNYPLTKKKI